VRTIVIDPYPLSRYGLTALLGSQSDFEVVRAVASPASLARSPKVDLVVVQTDGNTGDHAVLRAPIVEVRLHDAPHRILTAMRRQIALDVTTTRRAHGDLTTRELEVVALVADGHTDLEIADALYLSVRTVRSHLDRIRAKTGRRRRADLTRWYVERRDA
jgi:DNA-binding NarL/FixJ family response regulator